MAFALAGTPNAVATCGTALADEHFQILKNLARKVVLAYDADSAGQAAAERWYQWEQAYEVQVEVADLPAGRDPGDLWKDDRGALTTAIERAAPFLQFRIDRLLAGADLRTLESKARTAEDAAAISASHPSELVRDQYVMKLAGMLDIDADQLRAAVRAGPRRRPARESSRGGDAGAPPPPRPTQVDRRELDVLRWAIHSPELVADWLDASLFIDPAARSVFELLAESGPFQEALGARGRGGTRRRSRSTRRRRPERRLRRYRVERACRHRPGRWPGGRDRRPARPGQGARVRHHGRDLRRLPRARAGDRGARRDLLGDQRAGRPSGGRDRRGARTRGSTPRCTRSPAPTPGSQLGVRSLERCGHPPRRRARRQRAR